MALGLDGAQVRAETDGLDLPAFFDGARRAPVGARRIARGFRLFRKLGLHPADEVRPPPRATQPPRRPPLREDAFP